MKTDLGKLLNYQDKNKHFKQFIDKMTKYVKGNNCCGECNVSRHTQCRPRLDMTLCSCSCSRAIEVRQEAECFGTINADNFKEFFINNLNGIGGGICNYGRFYKTT